MKIRSAPGQGSTFSMFEEVDKKERMYEAGAEGYVLKTASADDLLAAIRGPGTRGS